LPGNRQACFLLPVGENGAIAHTFQVSEDLEGMLGGAHHTAFGYAVTAEHLRDFAEMAGIEFLVIDEDTRLETFKDRLRWNDLYYHLAKGF
jgi:L-arabinose isomerase